jgi:hypothetical protein
MKLRVAVLAAGALILATATVSAAIQPAIPTNRGALTSATTWKDLPIVKVSFPDNLDLATEGVFVLKTQAQWDSFWASVPQVTKEGLAVGQIPQPDFTHQFAVVASYGWKSEGYAISTTHAKFNGQQVAVNVDRQVPNPSNCRVYFDPFYGGISIVEQPSGVDFTNVPVGATYHQVMEARWAQSTRDCRQHPL